MMMEMAVMSPRWLPGKVTKLPLSQKGPATSLPASTVMLMFTCRPTQRAHSGHVHQQKVKTL